jgi:cytochrome c oxidase assembly protein subunit 19
MSMGSSWQRFSTPVAPERGAFPLDLQGECQELVQQYLACLKLNATASDCKHISKSYLKCRMDHNLMETDDFKNLGFKD